MGHRRTRDKREADRIKAVVLLATGWSAEEVAEVLLACRLGSGTNPALGSAGFRSSTQPTG